MKDVVQVRSMRRAGKANRNRDRCRRRGYRHGLLRRPTGRASHKELTTQSGPARGVMIGIDRLRADAEIIPRNRPRGARTTLFSNAVIERKRARTGLITTKGSATR